MIDASALDAPIEGAVDAITTQFPDLRLMIAGQSAEQTALARRIADSPCSASCTSRLHRSA
jgi:hypothetical protein